MPPNYRTRLRDRDQEHLAFARSQRRQANEFASDVWQMVRNSQILGQKFRREYPIGPYTVDFVCLAIKLVVEVDGVEHFTDNGVRRDAARDLYLQRLGYEVLRIRGYEVTQDPGKVRGRIERAVAQRLHMNPLTPHPSPPKRGRGEAASF